MVNSKNREVGSKNVALDSLNRLSGNAYQTASHGTPTLEVVAKDKYRKSESGSVPDEVAVDSQQATWTKRDWALTAGVAAACLFAFYLLLKYKIITI